MLSRNPSSASYRISGILRQYGAQQCVRRRLAIQPRAQHRTASSYEGFQQERRRRPFLTIAAAAAVVGSATALYYGPPPSPDWTSIPKVTHDFPEAVADELRKGIFCDIIEHKPKEALSHFHKALAMAPELGMDPLSAPVLGLKLRIGALYEACSDFDRALGAYGAIRSDCAKWVQTAGDGNFEDGKRSHVLQTAVRASTRIGELYFGPLHRNMEKVEEAFVWALDTSLRELKRREAVGVREGEGAFLDDEELGGLMERAAALYYETRRYDLAAPLYLKAVTLCPSNTCQAAFLMSSLGWALSQPTMDYLPLSIPGQTKDTTLTNKKVTDGLTDGLSWGRMAVKTADAVPAELSSRTCDLAKSHALILLGSLTALRGDNSSGVSDLTEARRIAVAINEKTLTDQADEILQMFASHVGPSTDSADQD